MTAVAATPTAREALLGPDSQRLEVGLLGARTAAVLRRVLEGLPLDEFDRATLETSIRMLESVAEAVEGVEAGKHLTRVREGFGFGAMSFTVEFATANVARSDLPNTLRRMASDLRDIQQTSDPQIAERLLPSFSALADVATRQAGSVGEGRGGLR